MYNLSVFVYYMYVPCIYLYEGTFYMSIEKCIVKSLCDSKFGFMNLI